MPNDAALRQISGSLVARSWAMPMAHLLFSTTNRIGSFHSCAMFMHSKNWPLLQVPSPKNAAVTALLEASPRASRL